MSFLPVVSKLHSWRYSRPWQNIFHRWSLGTSGRVYKYPKLLIMVCRQSSCFRFVHGFLPSRHRSILFLWDHNGNVASANYLEFHCFPWNEKKWCTVPTGWHTSQYSRLNSKYVTRVFFEIESLQKICGLDEAAIWHRMIFFFLIVGHG